MQLDERGTLGPVFFGGEIEVFNKRSLRSGEECELFSAGVGFCP